MVLWLYRPEPFKPWLTERLSIAMKYHAISDEWLSLVCITQNVLVNVNHGLLQNLYLCTAKLLSVTSNDMGV